MEYIAVIFFIVIVGLYYIFKKKGGGNGIGIGLFSLSASILSKNSRDLTKLAVEKKLDKVIGRKKEISRVVQILSRRNKNNPVLIGNAGVGKTAVAEGLALAIAGKMVPPVLYNKKVLALDLSGVLAGTKYRGEFEKRIKSITDEIVSANRTIILFIDEIHILGESGGAEGAINAADILKPMLARGELQVVGATTREEYEKFIKNDKTLDRRLQPVFIDEPTPAQTREILKGIKDVYEDYHHVIIADSAIKGAIELTNYIKGRSYPDKAIDALDEACSKARIESVIAKSNNEKPQVTGKDIKEIIAQWKEGQ